MSQEPGTNEEIKCFISGYKGDGKFDVFSKISVNGDEAHPLWKYLKHKQGGLLIEYDTIFSCLKKDIYLLFCIFPVPSSGILPRLVAKCSHLKSLNF